jgi:hypothetical protein
LRWTFLSLVSLYHELFLDVYPAFFCMMDDLNIVLINASQALFA